MRCVRLGMIVTLAAGGMGCSDEDLEGFGSSESSGEAGESSTGTPSEESSTSETPTTTPDPSSTSEDPDPGTTDAGEESGPGSEGDPGSTGNESDPVGCYDYDSFTPFAVSFRTDVMPIFAAACASCHDDPTASVYFGMGAASEAEASAIYTILLEGTPKQAPHLDFVTPDDPLRSYMLAKIEYPNPGGTCSEVQCNEPGCELPAPPAGPLSEGDKAIVRSWIMGGAQND